MSTDETFEMYDVTDDLAEQRTAEAWRAQTAGRRASGGISKQGIINPPIDEVLDKVDSKYQLVIFASKRARQINDYYTDIHEGSMFDNVGPLVDATIEDKALSVALHEIHRDKLVLTKNESVEA